MTEWEQYLAESAKRERKIYWTVYCLVGVVILVLLSWGPVSALFEPEEPEDYTYSSKAPAYDWMETADAIVITSSAGGIEITATANDFVISEPNNVINFNL